MKRGSAGGDANRTGAAGSMRAIPLINPGSMRAIAASAPAGSMRMLTAAPSHAAGTGAVAGPVDPAAVVVAVGAAGATRPTFARKVCHGVDGTLLYVYVYCDISCTTSISPCGERDT